MIFSAIRCLNGLLLLGTLLRHFILSIGNTVSRFSFWYHFFVVRLWFATFVLDLVVALRSLYWFLVQWWLESHLLLAVLILGLGWLLMRLISIVLQREILLSRLNKSFILYVFFLNTCSFWFCVGWNSWNSWNSWNDRLHLIQVGCKIGTTFFGGFFRDILVICVFFLKNLMITWLFSDVARCVFFA